MAGRWIFGYGSLVSPVSFGVTVGRHFTVGRDYHYAVLSGWGRRWNYGVAAVAGERDGVTYSLVALGIVPGADETANGVIGWVDPAELERLDRRELGYARVDVTDLVEATAEFDGRVETYVPKPESVERYAAARGAGTAAIEQRYWDLVAGAFAGFGMGERRRYLETTPAPDVPVLELWRPDPYR